LPQGSLEDSVEPGLTVSDLAKRLRLASNRITTNNSTSQNLEKMGSGSRRSAAKRVPDPIFALERTQTPLGTTGFRIIGIQPALPSWKNRTCHANS
jgi:hypothetical protein